MVPEFDPIYPFVSFGLEIETISIQKAFTALFT